MPAALAGPSAPTALTFEAGETRSKQYTPISAGPIVTTLYAIEITPDDRETSRAPPSTCAYIGTAPVPAAARATASSLGRQPVPLSSRSCPFTFCAHAATAPPPAPVAHAYAPPATATAATAATATKRRFFMSR